jgi:HK97 family phage prohead protease
MTGMERLVVPIEWKASAEDSGILEGYLSTFDNVDFGLDVVVKGAFANWITKLKADVKKYGPMRGGIPLLADHVASVASVIGTIFDAVEDNTGLLVKAKISAASSAQDARTKLVEGHLGKMSMGYEASKYRYEERDGTTVRLLIEVKVWEGSVVVFPMNPEAAITQAKEMLEQLPGPAQDAVREAIMFDTKATHNELREQLNNLLRDRYGADKTYVWVRDFDDTHVWFEVESAQEANRGVFEHSYTTDENGAVQLAGDRVEVRMVITYKPVNGAKETTIQRETKTSTPEGGATGDEPGADATDEVAAQESHAAGDEPASAPDEGAAGWDHWASEAVLKGVDPNAVADPATVAGLRTLLELNETALGGPGSNDTETE